MPEKEIKTGQIPMFLLNQNLSFLKKIISKTLKPYQRRNSSILTDTLKLSMRQ